MDALARPCVVHTNGCWISGTPLSRKGARGRPPTAGSNGGANAREPARSGKPPVARPPTPAAANARNRALGHGDATGDGPDGESGVPPEQMLALDGKQS